MKIAIVGSGISGLVTAWLLRAKHDITVFESNDYAGGHAHTIEVDVDGERHAIDTGFIVYNEQHYPNFTRLLRTLGVASQPTVMSFSVCVEQSGVEYNGTSFDTLFAQRRNLIRPRFWRMLWDIARFGREARVLLHERDTVTVSDHVAAGGYGRAFVEEYLVPLGASLWSCPASTFRRFPIRFVAEFLHNHAMLDVRGVRPVWRVISGGSQRYVERLTRDIRDRIRIRCPVRRILRVDRVRVTHGEGEQESFDHVVLACHADTALRLLGDVDASERQVLSAFPYQRNVALVHTDASVLPRTRRAWASWNYRVGVAAENDVQVTYLMNLLQGLRSSRPLCVTLNGERRVDPRQVLRRIEYHHPIFTTERARAQARHAELNGRNRTSFCGAYWGFGFHEDGVNSAMAVARALGESWS